MPLCPRCGVIAPAQQSACPICAEPFTLPRVEQRPPRAHAWVALRCSFQCRSCQFLSPLDELDIDGSVECGQCGQSQRFDVEAWHEALAFAHAVADLAYPLPEGRLSHPDIWIGDDNPFVALGHTLALAEHRQSSMRDEDGITIHRSLFIEAGPGHPVCMSCNEPLSVELGRNRESTASCRSCGAQTSYRLPAGASEYCAALAGVVADAHESGKQRARMQSSATGPVALVCPECGGKLPATSERVLQCEYCGTASLIPAQARVRDVGQVLTPDIWWLAFVGPSARRAALEAPPMPTIEAPEGLFAKLRNPKTALELVDEKPGLHLPQLLLNVLAPTLMLVIAIALYAAVEMLWPGIVN